MTMKLSKKIVSGLVAAAALTLTAAAFSKTNTYTDGMFTDVPAEQWYASEVKSTYELGLMQGVGGGLFQPDGNVTVAEAVTMAASGIRHTLTTRYRKALWFPVSMMIMTDLQKDTR